MNKIYRVVWNKATQTWAAVCEYAKAQGKSSGSDVVGEMSDKRMGGRFAYTMVMSGLLIATGQVAYAATVADGTGLNAIVIQGASSTATATGADSLAAGTNAAADGNSALAIGTNSKATGAYATAVGANVTAGGLNSITIGRSNNVTGRYTTVIGSGNIPKDGKGLDAAGGIVDVKAADTITATHSSIIGMSNQIAVSSVIGTPPPYAAVLTDVQVQGNNNIINRGHAYVFGSNNTINTNASNMELESVVAVGRQNTVSGNSSLAVGRLNTVAGGSALAVGINSQALGTDGIAIGNKAYASTKENSVAIGGLTHAGQFGTALGARTSVEGDQGAAVATGAVVKGARAVAVGSYSFAGPEDAVALGHNTAATGSRAVAMGAGSVVSGARSGAWGIATHGGQPQNNTTDRSFVGGTDSYAIGNKNIIGDKSSDSFVLGNNVKLGATGASIAITNVAGRDGTTNASTRTNAVTYTGATAITGAVALGSDTSVTVDNGVALGKGSVASTAAGQAGTDPLSAKDATASAGVWTATHAAVSVGNGTTVTRQITSVAAGTQDTDAVNVAQLKAAGFTLATSASAGVSEDKTVATATGAYDKKIQNGETVTVDAGKNIKVTQTGQTVSIATKDEVEFTKITLGDSTNNTVLTSTTDGLDVGGDKITKVANGDVSASSTDAINGSQLYTTNQNVANNATAIANNATEIAKGLNFGANDQTATSNTAINRKLGDTIGIKGGITDTSTATSGENVITRTDANGNINIELAKNAKFDSVTTGGTKLSDAGLSFVDTSGSPVANSPSISNTGINAGNQVIAGVKAGTQDTDAVNVKQLNDQLTATEKTTTAQAGSDKVTVTGTTTGNNTDYVIDLSQATKASLAKADTALQNVVSTDPNLTVSKNGDTVTLDFSDAPVFAGVTAGSGANQVVLNNDGVNVGGNTYISNAGLNANGKKVTNVADGTIGAGSKDAINGGQLQSTIDTLNTSITAAKTHLTAGDNTTLSGTGTAADPFKVNVATANATVTRGNVTVADDDKNKFLTAGDVAAAINGSEKTSSVTHGSDAVTVTADAEDTNGNTLYTVDVSDKTKTSLAKADSAVQSIKVKANGNDVTTLDQNNNTLEINQGDNITVSNDNGKVKVALNKDLTGLNSVQSNTVTANAVTSGTGDNQVVLNNDGVNVGGNTYISDAGLNANNKKVSNVANGDVSATSKDAINGSQLFDTANSVATALGGGATVQADGTVSAPTYNITNPADGTVITANNVGDALKGLNDAVNSPLTFVGDSGNFTRNLGQTTTVKGGITDTAKLSDNNIGVVAKDGTLDIKLAKDIALDSVTTGNTLVDNNGITIKAPTGGTTTDVKLTASGLNNGGNRITNVAPGVDATDAVNVSQLQGLAHHINNRIDDVSDDANAGVSSAMAMAALPQAYIPGKSMLTGGIASYNGEGAVAVGFSKLSDNGRWVLKVSGSADTQGNAGGAVGAGFHF